MKESEMSMRGLWVEYDHGKDTSAFKAHASGGRAIIEFTVVLCNFKVRGKGSLAYFGFH